MWIAFAVFLLGNAARLVRFFYGVVAGASGRDSRWRHVIVSLVRSFFPLHLGIIQRPVYAFLRYAYHMCLFAVPVHLWGHVVLWEESRFRLTWRTLPDAWADRLTILVIMLSCCLLCRRLASTELRRASRPADFALPLIVTFPFLSGYFLAHGTLRFSPFLQANLWTIHVLSGEIMLLAGAFLVCRNKLNTRKCTGCAACSISCPTKALTCAENEDRRVITINDTRCIHCGACVKDCPESAAEICHQIRFGSLLGIAGKKDTMQFALKPCIRCGTSYVPKRQYEKMALSVNDPYVLVCPRCRRNHLMDVLHGGRPALTSEAPKEVAGIYIQREDSQREIGANQDKPAVENRDHHGAMPP